MKKCLVFDIDDTISIHKNRDYKNAIPIQPVIDKLNRLYDEGYYIKLFTGRGQLSCNGNLDLIIERNKDILETWLKEHNVKYHELIFGKPLGDWYIDDKGLSVEDFLKADFVQLKGGSNSSIYREFNKVIKIANNSKAQYDWYLVAKKYNFNIPTIYSCVGDTLYMSFVDGTMLAHNCSKNHINRLIKLCYQFKEIECIDNIRADNLDKYCDNLIKHLDSEETKFVIEKLREQEFLLLDRQSFYHGDLTLSNIILDREDTLVLIDPNYKTDYCSYLLDLAKIRQSLHDYEYIFGFSKNKNSIYLSDFDEALKDDLYLVKLLELTHWIRMYDYKSEEDRVKVLKMINKLKGEL